MTLEEVSVKWAFWVGVEVGMGKGARGVWMGLEVEICKGFDASDKRFGDGVLLGSEGQGACRGGARYSPL